MYTRNHKSITIIRSSLLILCKYEMPVVELGELSRESELYDHVRVV